jgi:hypothetical protein
MDVTLETGHFGSMFPIDTGLVVGVDIVVGVFIAAVTGVGCFMAGPPMGCWLGAMVGASIAEDGVPTRVVLPIIDLK